MTDRPDGAGTPAEAKVPSLDYPCDYRFRVIGHADPGDFCAHVRALVGRVLGPVQPDSCSVRSSSGGKYESVTVHVHLPDEAARRAVYQQLWEDERVVFYL